MFTRVKQQACLKKATLLSVILFVALLTVGCGTYARTVMGLYGGSWEETEIPLPPISYDKAFEDAIKAGKYLGYGFNYKPNKNKGRVNLYREWRPGYFVALAVFIKREGIMATGVKIRAMEESSHFDSVEIEAYIDSYVDTLRKYWRAGEE